MKKMRRALAVLLSLTISLGVPVWAHDLADIPVYSGEPYVTLDQNVPEFTQDEKVTNTFIDLTELDDLGRCGQVNACVGPETLPTGERGAIGHVKPSGWHQAKYEGLVNSKPPYLYNRAHLLAWCLSGINDDNRNLITGTRYFNVVGMLPFETAVAKYIEETGDHVLYRVKPLFDGDNLLANGVEMQAYSVEDDGAGISFHVFCYNVNPHIGIDYSTGESWATADGSTYYETSYTGAVSVYADENEVTPEFNHVGGVVGANDGMEANGVEGVVGTNDPAADAQVSENAVSYVVNTNTGKFHYPSCKSVAQMSENNKLETAQTRDELIAQGYDPCKNCNP